LTVVSKRAVLLAGSESGRQLALVTFAVLVKVPAGLTAGTWATTVTVAEVGALVAPSTPSVQVAVPVPMPEQLPSVVVALTTLQPAGSVSVTTVPALLDGP